LNGGKQKNDFEYGLKWRWTDRHIILNGGSKQGNHLQVVFQTLQKTKVSCAVILDLFNGMIPFDGQSNIE
jgi:hypothetical protein